MNSPKEAWITGQDVVGAVFFDVDGTLVPGTSSSAYLAEHLGHHDLVANAERAYADGVVTNQQVSKVDAGGWAGHSPAQIANWLNGLPLVAGIADTVAWCQSRRLVPILATLAWEPVGRHLAERFGFHSFSGPSLTVENGQYTGDVSTDFDEYDKRDFALDQARALGISPDDCAAIGDSRSDLPLFATLGLSVAFNATATAKLAATEVLDGDDLRLTLPLLERLPRMNPS